MSERMSERMAEDAQKICPEKKYMSDQMSEFTAHKMSIYTHFSLSIIYVYIYI